jgi:hypothetical protein
MKNLIQNKFYIGQILYYSHCAYITKSYIQEHIVIKVLKTKIFVKNDSGDTYEIKINKKLISRGKMGTFFIEREDALLENKKRFFEEEIYKSFTGSTEDSVLHKLSFNELEKIVKIINTKKQNKII